MQSQLVVNLLLNCGLLGRGSFKMSQRIALIEAYMKINEVVYTIQSHRSRFIMFILQTKSDESILDYLITYSR